MGLDQYLRGRKIPFDYNNRREEDGFEVSSVVLELGYWRKHPNLHGYIVQTFADGVDECQEIPLSRDDLMKIREAASNPKSLPHTEGFFFGASYGTQEEADEDVAIIDKALEWLKGHSDKEWREVFYRASW